MIAIGLSEVRYLVACADIYKDLNRVCYVAVGFKKDLSRPSRSVLQLQTPMLDARSMHVQGQGARKPPEGRIG
eukprot:scaffold262192_cov30-Prasinocladus_malaysianus.AAC.1